MTLTVHRGKRPPERLWFLRMVDGGVEDVLYEGVYRTECGAKAAFVRECVFRVPDYEDFELPKDPTYEECVAWAMSSEIDTDIMPFEPGD